MSLVRIAARIAIVEALRGNTLVGDSVKDSLIGGIQVAADGSLNISDGERRPFITVYTDGAKIEGPAIRSLVESGATDIVLEWGITAGMAEIDPDTGESTITAGLPATDDAMEFQLDMIGRQIFDVLSDPENSWSQIWSSIASGGYAKLERARVSNDRDGTRLAAHQLRISAMLMDEPLSGQPVPEPFPDLFAMIPTSQDAALVAKLTLMQAAITGDDEPWKSAQRRFGLTDADLLALEIGPIAGDENRATPPLDAATITGAAQEDIEVTAE